MKTWHLFLFAVSVVYIAHYGVCMTNALMNHKTLDGAFHFIGVLWSAFMFAWAANKIIARLKGEP